MKVMADELRRVILPKEVHPGDVFQVEQQGAGQFLLTKLEGAPQPRPKLIAKEGLMLLSSERTITWEETRKAMDEFP